MHLMTSPLKPYEITISTRWCPRSSSHSVGANNSNFTMVYGTYTTIVFMGFINQFISGLTMVNGTYNYSSWGLWWFINQRSHQWGGPHSIPVFPGNPMGSSALRCWWRHGWPCGWRWRRLKVATNMGISWWFHADFLGFINGCHGDLMGWTAPKKLLRFHWWHGMNSYPKVEVVHGIQLRKHWDFTGFYQQKLGFHGV